MGIEIVGEPLEVSRIVTGLWSFDRAFTNPKKEVGFPLSMTEISGPFACGKSTTSYSLAGIIANQLKENISLADLEGYNPDYLTDVLTATGYSGKLYAIQEEHDKDALTKLADNLKDDSCVGILDSVGAISPLAEDEGELEEAHMGRRARLMHQFSRRIIKIFRSNNKRSLLIINHQYATIGGYGVTNPGGNALKYLPATKMRIKRKKEYDDQSYIIEGKVTKNRFGYKDRVFYIFMLAGTGIHLGLSAMWDCLVTGKAEYSKVVKIGDTSYGYVKDLIQKAHDREEDIFKPFMELLK